MHPTQLDRDRKYNATPRGRYKQHKNRAKDRGIGFLLTFEQWWSIWKKSGKWELRGNLPGQYAMCRLDDEGPYADGNVYIGEVAQNVSDRNFKFHGVPEKRSDRKKVIRRHTARSTSVSFKD